MIGTNVFLLEGIFGEVANDLGIDPQDQFDQIDTERAWLFGTVIGMRGGSYSAAQMYQAFFTEAMVPFYEQLGREIADSTAFFRLVTAQPAFGTISDR